MFFQSFSESNCSELWDEIRIKYFAISTATNNQTFSSRHCQKQESFAFSHLPTPMLLVEERRWFCVACSELSQCLSIPRRVCITCSCGLFLSAFTLLLSSLDYHFYFYLVLFLDIVCRSIKITFCFLLSTLCKEFICEFLAWDTNKSWLLSNLYAHSVTFPVLLVKTKINSRWSQTLKWILVS